MSEVEYVTKRAAIIEMYATSARIFHKTWAQGSWVTMTDVGHLVNETGRTVDADLLLGQPNEDGWQIIPRHYSFAELFTHLRPDQYAELATNDANKAIGVYFIKKHQHPDTLEMHHWRNHEKCLFELSQQDYEGHYVIRQKDF